MNSKKENEIINKKPNKIYELPNEIFINILYYLNDFNDLLNIYEVFTKYNELIDNKIYEYLNIKSERRKKNHFMMLLLSYIENKIEFYFFDSNLEYEKQTYIDEFKNLYDKSNISKKVIRYYLRCDICEYIFDNKIINKQFYKCINCKNITCEFCGSICQFCDPYKNIEYFHCLDCEKYCNNNINNK